ncbi:hypothetical protein ABTZ03_40875 [Kitasatospora sp. NPDC096077]|uniref:hypothetical protein n=1 Tax=Kitasatospora sp. NPDC096077 TaxID=3155544 RepID=UPI00331BBBCD
MTDGRINLVYVLFLVVILLRFFLARRGQGSPQLIPGSTTGRIAAGAGFVFALGTILTMRLSWTGTTFALIPSACFALGLGWLGDLATRRTRARR